MSGQLAVNVLASGRHHGPVYFFGVGIGLIAFFVPALVVPNSLRRFNDWLGKSKTVRRFAKWRYGTDGSDGKDQVASDRRIRIASAVAVAIGLVFLVIGIVMVSR